LRDVEERLRGRQHLPLLLRDAGHCAEDPHAGSIKPILENSLDAMVASMVAPQLSRFDLRVHPISENDDDGDVEGFLHLLAQPLQATTNSRPLPNVISVSFGVCESIVQPYTASRTLVERQLTATAGARHHQRRRGR
jgi:hypothetical protein